MSSMIRTPSEIDVSKFEFSAPKLLSSGGKSVNLRYEGRNLMVETPSLNVPYGINVFDKAGPANLKYSLDLSLRGADENAEVRAVQEFMEAFDERMIDAGVENAGAWFKMAKPNRDVIKAFYTPLVKVSRDADGNPKPYPPTFKVALRKKILKKPGEKDGATDPSESLRAFDTSFYNGTETDEKGQPTVFETEMNIKDLLVKRSQVTTIIQCTGIWFAGGKYGTTWKAVQMRVDSQPEQIRGPAFRSDAPDIRAFVSKTLTAKAPAPAAVVYEEAEEDEDEGYGGGAPAPAPVKKPAPAPVAAATFEEEDVAEPVPVPKKVVKKVVAKKA
jgi:hypothetical protein